MKFDYETGKDAKMSSKKKKSSTKSKPADVATFSESRSTSQNSGKGDGETQGFSSSAVHEMSSFTDRDRFPDGNWPKDGYGKMSTLPPPPSHFNNFNPGFSNMVSYGRNNEDGDSMRMMRNEHYPGYDVGKSGFMNNPGVGRHVTDSQLGMLPPRPSFPGGSIPPGLTHGYGTNTPSGFMPHPQTPGMGQQTYQTPTPMLTQLLRYPNPGEKFPSGQMDEYRATGPPKNWMDNMAPGMNQNAAYPSQRPSMPFYEPRPMHPQMNQTHLNQISVPAVPGPAGPHGSQAQVPSGSANPSNPGIFAPPPYIQSCNPASSAQRVEANEKLAPLPQQRSSSQSRPMSAASSSGPSLGSPNHIRPISPVPSSGPAHGHQSEKAGSSLQKTSSSSKAKKRKEEVNSIQDISSCDEGGSDSSSSTEVYSQITPMSTPSTTPLPPQSAGGGTKHSPQGSDESPSNTPAPGMATAPSSGAMTPTVLPVSSSSMSLTGASSLSAVSQPLESSHGVQATGGQNLSGLKTDHVRSSNPCSTFEVGAKPPYSSYSQMQASQMTAYNSQYSNYGPGNYPRSPGAQQAYRGQTHPNQYGNPAQMYGAATGPPGMHPNQPCGNYPYPGPGKVVQGPYMHGHSQAAMTAGMHHPMEMENAVSGGAGKGYGMPGGMYGPGKLGGQSASGSMVNANMPGLHYHPSQMGQSNPPHPGQFSKSGYGAQFGTGPGNGVGPSPHHQHMGPYPGGPYGSHVPPPGQMQYAPRPMASPVPHGTGGPGIVDHSGMRPTSPAFYRGGPVGYEGDPASGPMNSSSGRSQWVMNMQGMSGGSLVEAPRGENIPMDMPPVSIPSGSGEIQRVRNPAFEPQMGAKDHRSSASPISSSDCTSAESKSCESMMPVKHLDQPKMENDFSNASAADSQGRGMMSPGVMPPKSVEMDSSKKDIGSDSNSLPGQERSRPESDKQETLSSPPSTPFNHITSSPASLERDISSPSVHSSKSSGSSSVFNKIADMGSEHDRGIFLERLFAFMSFRGTPITAVPVICKQTVDLYRLYHLVRERSGMVEVTKNKKWREVSTSLNLGASSSAGFTLKRNYAKFLFPFECRYDRGNIDPAPIIASMEMSSKKDSKKNMDRTAVDIDNCRPPSNQSFSGYPVPGPHPHGMQMPDLAGRGMHPTMMVPSPSPYNGGMVPASMGRAGMMSPGGMVPNHSSMSRSSVESLGSAQDTVSIQDPFLDAPGGSGGGQYMPPQGNVNSLMPMYGASGDHPGSMHGPYEHRSNMAASGVPPSPAPSMYSGASNQCMPSSMAGPANQGNGFSEMCGTSRGREPGFGNHAIHGNDYGAAGAGYGAGLSAQGQGGINCQPPGDRFDGSQPGYPSSVPKHPPPSESLSSTEQNYYSHYGNQMPTSQRYGPGYDPHFYGGAGQAPVPGYSGPQKMTGPGLDVFSPQGHHPIEGPMIGHAMGPPHPPGPYPMQKQGPGSMGGIPKGDGVYPHPTHDYQIASQQGGGRTEGSWMSHQYGQHYPPQPYPGSHGMHPNANASRGPYGMYPRYPVPGMQRYDMEKMQRGPGGPHHLSPNRDVVFPPGSVEATRPKLIKRKKLTHKDMGSVDAWRLMMALRSGLITESTWALDVLTVLLRDDVTSSCLSLSHMPGLLEVLVEHYRRCLILIFGTEFEELEVSSEMQSRYTAATGAMETEDAADEEDVKAVPDAKALQAPGNYTLKTHDGKTVGIKVDSDERLLDHKSWDVFKEFESSAFDWQMGRGDMTLHIITTLASDGSHDFHRKRYFGKNYESLKRKAEVPPEEVDRNLLEVSIKSESNPGSRLVNGAPSVDRVENSSNSIEENSSDPASVVVSSNTNNAVSEANSKISSNMDSNVVSGAHSDDLKQETTSDKVQSDEPRLKVTMDFDNFDNNLFTCTQLESLKRSCSELDEETYRPNDRVSCRLTDSQLEISQRCLCLSNIFRNLSFIAGNDNEICKHNGLMLILGKLLLLNHQHLPRLAKTRVQLQREGSECVGSPPTEVDSVTDEVADGNTEWWWEMLEGLRENTLVVFANICGQLDLSSFPEEICLPILNGLLHWLVCSSAEALDPLTATGLSPQRLVLEALCKLCVTDSNIDLVLATPPFSRIVLLITNLASMLSERHQQVVREFAVGLLSCLVPGDSSVSRALALQHPSVTLLLEFIEGAEQQALQMMNAHGAAVLRDNPEIMGTSLDMLCRAASILRHLVDVPENVPLLSRHQLKLMQLVMSQILDRSVTAILADVLNSCS